METANLARRLVPADITVRSTKQSIVLSDGRWSAEVETERLLGLPEDEAIAALRPEIDRAIAALKAAHHGEDAAHGAA